MPKPLVVLLLCLAASCWTERAHAQSSDAASVADLSPAPSEAKTRRLELYDRNANIRIALLATGIPLFVLSYGLPCAGSRGVWCAPVVGPIIKIKQIADREAQADPEEDGIIPPVFVYTLLAELAALQLASASLVAAGALMPRREGRRMVETVTLVPALSPSTLGLTAVGTF